MTQLYPKRAIVIVEDNEPVARLIRDTLNTEPGFRGVVVHDGAEALDVIHSIDVSAVVLDVSLPGMSGIELYDRLRSEDRTAQVPVIFVTACHDSPELARRGITNVLPKPFNIDELLVRVNMTCEGIDPDPPLSAYDDVVTLDARNHDLGAITSFLNSAD